MPNIQDSRLITSPVFCNVSTGDKDAYAIRYKLNNFRYNYDML